MTEEVRHLEAERGRAGVTPETATDADRTIRAIVKRLARPARSGGSVIEFAAIRAAGADSRAIIGWILDHGGEPEASAPPAPARGLHGTRPSGEPPRRYVLPAGTLT